MPASAKSALARSQIAHALRQTVVVAGHAQTDEVVADVALSEQCAINHRLAVDHQFHRLDDARVVVRRQRGVHGEAHCGAARVRSLHGDIRVVLLGKRDRRCQLVGEVNLARLQRIDAGGRIADRHCHHAIQWSRLAPPVLIADQNNPIRSVVGLHAERSRSVGQLPVVDALGHDGRVERQRRVDEVSARPQQRPVRASSRQWLRRWGSPHLATRRRCAGWSPSLPGRRSRTPHPAPSADARRGR